jgi:hypothetical protein
MEKDNSHRRIIAHRTYALDDRAGAVTITMFAPEPLDGGRDWRCPYRIDGLEHGWDSHACGVDPLQALTLALKKIAIELYVSPEAREGRLTWLQQGRGDLGLPMPDGMEEWYRDEAR